LGHILEVAKVCLVQVELALQNDLRLLRLPLVYGRQVSRLRQTLKAYFLHPTLKEYSNYTTNKHHGSISTPKSVIQVSPDVPSSSYSYFFLFLEPLSALVLLCLPHHQYLPRQISKQDDPAKMHSDLPKGFCTKNIHCRSQTPPKCALLYNPISSPMNTPAKMHGKCVAVNRTMLSRDKYFATDGHPNFWRQESYRLSMYERSGSPFTMLLTILSCSSSSLDFWFPRGGFAATELLKLTVFGSTFAVGARAGTGFGGDGGAGVESKNDKSHGSPWLELAEGASGRLTWPAGLEELPALMKSLVVGVLNAGMSNF